MLDMPDQQIGHMRTPGAGHSRIKPLGSGDLLRMKMTRRTVLGAVPLLLAPPILRERDAMPTTIAELYDETAQLRAAYLGGAPQGGTLAALAALYQHADAFKSSLSQIKRNDAVRAQGWQALLMGSVLSDGPDLSDAARWTTTAEDHAEHVGDTDLRAHALMRHAIIGMRKRGTHRTPLRNTEFASRAEEVASRGIRSYPETYARALAVQMEAYAALRGHMGGTQAELVRQRLEHLVAGLPVQAPPGQPWAFTQPQALQAMARAANDIMVPKAQDYAEQALTLFPREEIRLTRISRLTRAESIARGGDPDTAVSIGLKILRECPLGPTGAPEVVYRRSAARIVAALPDSCKSKDRLRLQLSAV